MLPGSITRIQYVIQKIKLTISINIFKEFKEISSNKNEYYSIGLADRCNWYDWDILLYGPVINYPN